MTQNKSYGFCLQLRGALIQNGWVITKVEEEDRWFAEDHWTVRSERQAYGHELILSFMIDPMSDSSEKFMDSAHGEIYSVRVSQLKPTNRFSGDKIAEFYKRKGHLAEEISAFIDALDTHRNNIQNVPKCTKEEGDENGTRI